jgi:hypothetical protein
MDIQPTAQLNAGGAVPASAVPPIARGAPGPQEDGGNGARGIIVGLGGIWVAVGLYVAPIATLIWVVGVGAICVAAAWWSQWLDERTYDRVAQGCCAQCGYDLRGCGQSGDCPECGAWFGLGWGAAIPADKNKALAEAAQVEAEISAEALEHSATAGTPEQQPQSGAGWQPDQPLQGL